MPLDGLIIGMTLLNFNWLLVVSIAIVGLTVGSAVMYSVGRYGFSLNTSLENKRNTKNFKKAQALYQKYGYWTLVFSFMPLVGKFFPLTAGLMKTSWIKFLSFYILGKIVYYGLILFIIKL